MLDICSIQPVELQKNWVNYCPIMSGGKFGSRISFLPRIILHAVLLSIAACKIIRQKVCFFTNWAILARNPHIICWLFSKVAVGLILEICITKKGCKWNFFPRWFKIYSRKFQNFCKWCLSNSNSDLPGNKNMLGFSWAKVILEFVHCSSNSIFFVVLQSTWFWNQALNKFIWHFLKLFLKIFWYSV